MCSLSLKPGRAWLNTGPTRCEETLWHPSCHSECEIQNMTCQEEPLQHIVAMQLSLKYINLQRKTFKLVPRGSIYKCTAPVTLNVTFSTGSSLLNKQMSGNDPSTSSSLWLLSIFWRQTGSAFLLVCVWEGHGVFASHTHLNYALLSSSFVNEDKNVTDPPRYFNEMFAKDTVP